MKTNPYYQPQRRAVIECADKIEMRSLDVVLPNFLFRKKVTLLAGPPASGKGAIEVAIATRASCGGSHPSWPDPTPSSRGKVLFFTGSEDDPEDTVIPRLMAAGADMSRIFFFREMRQNGSLVDANFGIQDIEAIERFIQRCGGGFSVLIVDPITQAIEGDSTSQANVLRSLDHLAVASARLNLAILAAQHVVKSAKGRDPLGRVAGPIAYGGKPRAVWVTAHNPNKINGEDDFVLVNVKSSLTAPAGGWGYRIEKKNVANEYDVIETSVIRWGQRYEGLASEILQEIERTPAKKADALERAIHFLEKILQKGPVSHPEIHQQAMAKDISGGTLARAKKALGVTHRKQSGVPHGPYCWFLPG
jgi:putative DNA primase/helicase